MKDVVAVLDCIQPGVLVKQVSFDQLKLILGVGNQLLQGLDLLLVSDTTHRSSDSETTLLKLLDNVRSDEAAGSSHEYQSVFNKQTTCLSTETSHKTLKISLPCKLSPLILRLAVNALNKLWAVYLGSFYLRASLGKARKWRHVTVHGVIKLPSYLGTFYLHCFIHSTQDDHFKPVGQGRGS